MPASQLRPLVFGRNSSLLEFRHLRSSIFTAYAQEQDGPVRA